MRVAMVGIAWYTNEDYETLLSLFTDRDKFPSRYEEWLKSAERLTDQLRRNGQAFQKVYLDPKTFPGWCAARGMDINAQARMRFANEFVAGKDSDEK